MFLFKHGFNVDKCNYVYLLDSFMGNQGFYHDVGEKCKMDQ